MADKPDEKAGEGEGEAGAKPSLGKKKKIMIALALVLVLLAVALGGWFYLARQKAADLVDEDGEEVVQKEAPAPKGPPTFLPLDPMVVNLADPGGEKVAQLGVTLELSDAKATAHVKPYLPAIRNSVLLLVSQSTSEELLKREGKDRLAADILKEASRNFESADPKAKGKEHGADGQNPIRNVLFFSFIIQ